MAYEIYWCATAVTDFMLFMAQENLLLRWNMSRTSGFQRRILDLVWYFSFHVTQDMMEH
jgi:hypothetical protein